MVEHSYDAWGKPLSVSGSLASTVGAVNPLRYRGYYYDTETGFYYLQSRYYDSAIGRFISSDKLLGANDDIIGYNLFAYCSNNPVNMSDYGGQDAIFVVDYRNGSGLPIVGHSFLLIQDRQGVWYMTEYAGSICA